MVRFKPVPRARGIDILRAVHGAVPADPGLTDDCCAYLQESTGLPSRQVAEEWLVFLRALELVAENERGYYRLEWQPEDAIAAAFRNRVAGAREVLDVIDNEGSLSRAALIARFDSGDKETVEFRRPLNEGRLGRLLGWGEILGLIEQSDGQYRLSNG